MHLLRVLLCSSTLVALTGRLAAHEGWLEPDAYHVAPGDSVRLSLRVGENFTGEARPLNTERTAALQHFSAGGRTDERPRLPAPPGVTAVEVPLTAPGTHLFALDGQPNTIELPADKFLAYLTEEGLDAVVQARRDCGREQTPGRERYRRCVKTLVRVGPVSDGTFAVRTGQRLELVPVTDPLAARAGATLALTVLFHGQPLAHADVRAWSSPGPDRVTLKGRTDANGVVTLTLPHAGSWLIALVHIVPLKDVPDLDWESSWASLTFELAP